MPANTHSEETINQPKMQELVHLFCEELNATQIAAATGFSRVTINNYFKFFRIVITRKCVEDDAVQLNNYFGKLDVPVEIVTSSNGNFTLLGLISIDDYVFVNPLTDAQLNDVNIASKISAMPYHAIISLTDKTFMYSNKGVSMISKDSILNQYFNFLQSRIKFLRGLHTSTAFVHIKEISYRFNNRDNENFSQEVWQMIKASLK